MMRLYMVHNVWQLRQWIMPRFRKEATTVVVYEAWHWRNLLLSVCYSCVYTTKKGRRWDGILDPRCDGSPGLSWHLAIVENFTFARLIYRFLWQTTVCCFCLRRFTWMQSVVDVQYNATCHATAFFFHNFTSWDLITSIVMYTIKVINYRYITGELQVCNVFIGVLS